MLISMLRNFTKYYLHARFQINWTIQTEITEGSRISPPPAIPICKKPGLFRVKGIISENLCSMLESLNSNFACGDWCTHVILLPIGESENKYQNEAKGIFNGRDH